MNIPADFKGRAKKLEDTDLPRIAASIGCGEDEVHMLIDVEAAGSGFDTAGRPKMLFEPHKIVCETSFESFIPGRRHKMAKMLRDAEREREREQPA